jgi:hypothetical protein
MRVETFVCGDALLYRARIPLIAIQDGISGSTCRFRDWHFEHVPLFFTQFKT